MFQTNDPDCYWQAFTDKSNGCGQDQDLILEWSTFRVLYWCRPKFVDRWLLVIQGAGQLGKNDLMWRQVNSIGTLPNQKVNKAEELTYLPTNIDVDSALTQMYWAWDLKAISGQAL